MKCKRIQKLVVSCCSLFYSKARKEQMLKAETANILKSIGDISNKSPELIDFLNEMPQSMEDNSSLEIEMKDLKEYNQSLRLILKKYREENI